MCSSSVNESKRPNKARIFATLLVVDHGVVRLIISIWFHPSTGHTYDLPSPSACISLSTLLCRVERLSHPFHERK
eukprot:CFRG4074T1